MPGPTTAVDSHVQRDEIINALLAGESTRTIALRVTPPVSHMSIARYKNLKIKAALLGNPNSFNDKQTNAPRRDEVENINRLANVTKQALDADYITSRINAKLARLDGAIAKTLTAKDYDAYSKLETNDSKAIELLAKATMHPGFVATASHQTEVTVSTIVVMPNPDLCNGSVSGVSTAVTARSSRGQDIDISPL